MQEQTKKIKEVTIKGLEPEIQRLVEQHKAQMKQLQSMHEEELDRTGGDQSAKHRRFVSATWWQ